MFPADLFLNALHSWKSVSTWDVFNSFSIVATAIYCVDKSMLHRVNTRGQHIYCYPVSKGYTALPNTEQVSTHINTTYWYFSVQNISITMITLSLHQIQ